MCETDLCLGVIGLASRHICGCGCLGGTTTTPINNLRTRTRTLCGIRGQSPSIRDEHRVVSFSLLSSSSSSRSVIKSRPPRSVRRPHFQHHDHVPPLKINNTTTTTTMKPISLAALAAPVLVQAGLRFGCSTLTIQRVDPVVEPGAAPAAHLHHIVGGGHFNMTMEGDIGAKDSCTTCVMAEDLSNVCYFRRMNLYEQRLTFSAVL